MVAAYDTRGLSRMLLSAGACTDICIAAQNAASRGRIENEVKCSASREKDTGSTRNDAACLPGSRFQFSPPRVHFGVVTLIDPEKVSFASRVLLSAVFHDDDSRRVFMANDDYDDGMNARWTMTLVEIPDSCLPRLPRTKSLSDNVTLI